VRCVNEFLATAPFDIYELSLFRLVVTHGSFTKAAEVAGLTQSAITRQVQGMEQSLGLELLERTTRSVKLTPAGAYLFEQSAHLIGSVDETLRGLREQFAGARKVVRVGVSNTIGLAYLPGFFHANLRKLPHVGCRVSSQRSPDIIAALEANDLDVGVLCLSARLPKTLRITHRFADAFTLLAPFQRGSGSMPGLRTAPGKRDELRAWLHDQSWLLIDERSSTGQQLRSWMKRQRIEVEPAMQLDNFDLIINLVALGMGVSFVPVRALALYGRKRAIQRIPLPDRFVRELVVVTRASARTPEHVSHFVDNVLF
jgi:DNA-binding transcriptional LysR family regulator